MDNIGYFTLQKPEESARTRFNLVGKGLEKIPFFQTTSDNVIPVYIQDEYYNKELKITVKGIPKLSYKGKHVTKIKETKKAYNGYSIYWGDIKGKDLLIFLSKDQLHNAEVILFKDRVSAKKRIIEYILSGEFDLTLNQLRKG